MDFSKGRPKKVIILGFVLIFLLVSFFVSNFVGFNNYIKAQHQIELLPKTIESNIRINNFYGKFWGTKYENNYGGILIAKWKYGIWVLGKDGIKYFYQKGKVDYQIIDGCNQKMSSNFSVDASLKTNDFLEWKNKSKIGSNIVILNKNKISGMKNVMDLTVFNFNWWYFLKFDPEQQCQS